MVEAFAVYDPATGKAFGVFPTAALAEFFRHHVVTHGNHKGALRVDPWAVPAEIFEAE